MKATTDIIGLWPDVESFAKDAGVSPDLVYVWRSRGAIPSSRWYRLERAASKRGIPGVSMSVLGRITDHERTHARPGAGEER